MIALTLCVFYVSMYVKEVLLLMTGSAIDEDGSKEYSLMAATSNSCFGLLLRLITLLWRHCGFHQYISEVGEGHK